MDMEDGENCFLCPCCKACKNCTAFQKILDLQDKGLVIYRHPKCIEDQDATGEVFVLHNTTNFEIKTSDFIPEIEEREVSCFRCRHIMRHAKALLKSVPTIDKKNIVVICEHCRKKAESRRSHCYNCDRIVKIFVDRLVRLDDLCGTHGEYKRYVKSESRKLSTPKKKVGLYASYEDLSFIKKSRAKKENNLEMERILLSGSRERSVNKNTLEPSLYASLSDISWITEAEVQKTKKDESTRNRKDLKFSENKQEFKDFQRKSFSDDSLQPSNIEIYTPKHIKIKASSMEEMTMKSIKPILLHHHRDEKTNIVKKHDIPVEVVSKEHFKFNKEVSEDSSHNYFKYVFPRAPPKIKKSILSHVSSAKLIKDTHDKLLIKDEIEKKEQGELQKKKKDEKEKKRVPKENKKGVSSKGLVSMTSKIAYKHDEYYKTKQKETDKVSRKKDGQIEEKQERDNNKIDSHRKMKGKLSMQKVTTDRDKDRKKYIGKDEILIENKDDIQKKQIEKEHRQEKDKGKDLTQKDKERIQAIKKDDTQEIKEGKLPGVEDNTQRENQRKQSGESEMTKHDKRLGKVSKETQIQKNEKGKLPKETQTIKSKETDAKNESSTKEAMFSIEKSRKQRLKEEQPPTDQGKIHNQEKLTQEKARIHEEKPKKRENQEALSKHKGQNMTVSDTLKKAKELADSTAMRPGAGINVPKLLDMKDFPLSPSHVPKSEIELDERTVKPLKELNVKEIVLKKTSSENFALKENNKKDKDQNDETTCHSNVIFHLLKIHQLQHSVKVAGCRFCDDSSLTLDITLNRNKDTSEIIRGEHVVKNIPLIIKEKKEHYPLLLKTTYNEDSLSENQSHPIEVKKVRPPSQPGGIIRYALSDRSFIDKGWTLLPTEKVVRKTNIYRMRPAHPEFDWFEHHKNKQLLYDTGEALADFNINGRGRWFYKNGRVALDYYDAEDVIAQRRYIVYSSGELDDRGRTYPITVLATFDYSGNGVVFDHKGKIRLKYNQTEGVVLDRALGPVSHWKWHSLNDPPQLQQVMIDTYMPHKDPQILQYGEPKDSMRPDNYDEDMVAIEFDNFIKEKNKKMSFKTFKPFQIKMKALKINDQFSLRILDQATIYLLYREGTTNLKLNLGMLLDHKEIIDTDTADVGIISNSLERLPAQTDSILNLQSKIQNAKRTQRLREEHDTRLRPRMAIPSVDQLTAGKSRPLHPVLLTVPSSSQTAIHEQCKCSRKPLSTNLYYSTKFV